MEYVEMSLTLYMDSHPLRVFSQCSTGCLNNIGRGGGLAVGGALALDFDVEA